MNRLIVLCALLLALPAAGRVKIDRYESASLPQVKLWVSLLDDTLPIPPKSVRNVSVFADGDLVTGDIEWEIASEREMPIAASAVIDARGTDRWESAQRAMKVLMDNLPDDSMAFAIVTHDGARRIPKSDWTEKPSEIPPSLRSIKSGGEEPQLFRAVRMALRAYPLAEGYEPEPDGEVEFQPMQKEGDPPFPFDRVLFLIGDGELESGDDRAHQQIGKLIKMARRRGVRIMSIGVTTGSDSEELWSLRTLARKTGGTYRRADLEMGEVAKEVSLELGNRMIITAELDGFGREDEVAFQVKVTSARGEDFSRDFVAKLGNVLGFWARLGDTIADAWEGLPWWGRLLIVLGASLIGAIIVLLVVWRKAKKAAAARQAANEERQAELDARRPCPICTQMMLPDWTECLFCKRSQVAERPMRFRLIGRAGVWMGQALRFDKELITFGAGPECDVQIVDRGVSIQHAGLRDRGDEEFVLTDFNIDGGTFVNGERIDQIPLDEGDLIRVGECEFVFGIES